MSANQYLQDAAIRHAIYSERYGRGLAKRIVSLLDEVDSDLTDQLTIRLGRIADGIDRGPATTRRLTEIMEGLGKINNGVYRRMLQTLQSELIDLAAFEVSNQAATLANAVPVPVVTPLPTPAYLHTLVTTTPIDGFLLKPWVESMASGRLSRIEQALRIGMAEGQTVDQLVRRIRGTRANGFKDGILEISRKSATSLALTANSTIANAARERTYQDNSHLISKLKWLATLDGRTSPVCQSRDGVLYDLDKPHPTPPAHIRCRSVLIPVTVPFSELGVDAKDYTPAQRASMDGQVPGNTTYEGWLRNQPRSRVEDIYGKERADLFLSGKVKFNDLYKNDGGFYSLSDLKKKAKAAPSPAPAPAPAPRAAAPEPAPINRTLAEINEDNDRDLKAYTLTEGRKRGKEHMALYDAATGRELERVTDGKKGSVAFTPAMLAALRDPTKKMVIHHNHPSSSSFSPADLSIVHDFPGAKAIWAHGHNGSSYYAEAGPRRMSKQNYSFLRTQAKQWIQRKVNAREIETSDANLIFYHLVSRLVEKRGLIVYRVDLQGETLEAYNRTKPLIEEYLSTIKGHAE